MKAVSSTSLLSAALALLLAVSCAATEPTALQQLHAGPKARAEFGPAPSGKVMLLIDGRPTPVLWAFLHDGSDQNYTRCGFNTVFAELVYPGRNRPLEEYLAGWDRLLLDIKQRGQYVVIYLHSAAAAGTQPWDLGPEWRRYVQMVVSRYRGITNLVGWNLQDEIADNITYPDAGLRRFLQAEYGSLGLLNTAWGSGHGDWEQVRLEYQRAGYGRPEPSMVTPKDPFGVGPKAFDSAQYKLERLREVHAAFEAAVREVDPHTPLWSGAQNLGWPITQVPPGWGAFFDLYPQFSGDDFATHHVWAMDIGRGPNVRAVMQTLLPDHPERFDWHLDARVLRGWMVESVLHGAAGITIWPGSFLGHDLPGDRSSSAQRYDTLGLTVRTLTDSGLFERLPLPTIAVLYQPYAEGWGAMSQVWGLLRPPSGEPLPLLEELKFGTRWGQVEYLTT